MERIRANLSMAGPWIYWVVPDAVKAHPGIHRRDPHLPAIAVPRARTDGTPLSPQVHRQVQVREGARSAARELREELQAGAGPLPLHALGDRAGRSRAGRPG